MEILKTKLMRMCDSFNAGHYGLPENEAQFGAKSNEI